MLDGDLPPMPTKAPKTVDQKIRKAKVTTRKPAPKTLRTLEDRIVQAPATELKHVSPINEGTKKHLTAEALLVGATPERLMEVAAWYRATALSALTFDMRASGLGVERRGGVYFLLPAGVNAIPVKAKGQTREAALTDACK